MRPGVWEPTRYVASPWELTPPALRSADDELREYLRCASSLPYFALHYCWTLHVDDPDGAQVRRLPAYPFVREVLADIQHPTNDLTEKSRQMLTSWIFVSAFLHDLLFVKNAPLVMASRRAKEVDDGGANSTIDSLMGKLRFLHERLPPFLWHPFDFKLYQAKSLVTSSYVKGETGTGGQVARGPAYRRGLWDESAYSKFSESMFAGLRQACKRGLHLNSTPNGRGNTFARLAHSKTTTFKKRTLHWTRHPEMAGDLACLCGWKSKRAPPLPDVQFAAHRAKCPRKEGPRATSTYYRRAQADLPPEKVASELDISYDSTTGAVVFDGFNSARHVFEVAEQLHRRTKKAIGGPDVGEVDTVYRRRALAGLIDPAKQLLVWWDFGVSDETYIAIGQVIDEGRQETRWLDEVVDKGKAWDFYHRYIVSVWMPAYLEACGWTPDTMRAWAVRRELDWSARVVLVPDFVNELPRGCLPVYHAGDPAGRQRDSSLSSWTRNLAMADPPMLLHTVPFAKPDDGSLLDWIDHTRQLVRRDRVTVSSLCTRLADALGGWKWPTDREGNVLPGRQLPVHDKHSHPGTAFVMGYRTRWRGQLLAIENRGREAQHALVVTATDDERRTHQRSPERMTSRRGPLEPTGRGEGERWLHPQDTDEPNDDDFDDEDD